MQVTLLGTGGPRPDPHRQAPANLVRVGGLNLVFDAGRGVATQLAKAGVRTDTIDAIFITHHHYDHIGGLGDLLMAAWNNQRADPLAVYGPVGTTEIIAAIFNTVYRRDIAYRIAEERALGAELLPPTQMVDVHERMSGRIDLGSGVHVTVGEVEHGSSALDLAEHEWATVGYRIEGDNRSVAISGDAVAGRKLGHLAANADLLIMCAYFAADEIDSEMARFLTAHVIAGAPQAAQIAREAGVQTLVLTHIREKPAEHIERMVDEVARIFPGKIIAAEDMMVMEV